jgi:eukaryotic-like serine/threonine-protein kinase
MATVFLAHDRELDRPVAVKVLAATDEQFTRRFRREAMTAAGLSHPNVVSVFDAGEEDRRLFIVMEHVDGEGLDVLLAREGRLDPGRAVGYVVQACAGLGHAHERGIVHRDVKPANLLLRADGLLKVTDFGIAQARDATKLTQVGTLVGTASYIAPEQARGEEVGPQADLFSLGVVLYELLSGEPPWRVTSLAELPTVGQTPPPPLGDAPPHVEAAVRRCLDPDPRKRPPSAEVLADELGRAEPTAVTLARAPAKAPTALLDPAPRRATRRAVPRRTAALSLAAVAAVALAAGLVAGGGSNEPAPTPVVEPVPSADDPAQQARNLAEWLREHTEGAD